jgi:flagellar hook-length control protein FliK
MMPVAPGSDAAPSPGRAAGGSTRGPVERDNAFADMVGQLVERPQSTPKPVKPVPRPVAPCRDGAAAEVPAVPETPGPPGASPEPPPALIVLLAGTLPGVAAGDDFSPTDALVPAEASALPLPIVAPVATDAVESVPVALAAPADGDSQAATRTSVGSPTEAETHRASQLVAGNGPRVDAPQAMTRGIRIAGTDGSPAAAPTPTPAAEFPDQPSVEGLRMAECQAPTDPVDAPATEAPVPEVDALPDANAPAEEATVEPSRQRRGPDDRPSLSVWPDVTRSDLPGAASPRAEEARPAVVSGTTKGLAGAASSGGVGLEPMPAVGTGQAAEAANPLAGVPGAAVAAHANRPLGERRRPAAEPRGEPVGRPDRGHVGVKDLMSFGRHASGPEAPFMGGGAFSPPMASRVATAVAAAAPLRLEADVLAARNVAAVPAAAPPAASGIPFVIDLQTALRSADPAVPVALSVAPPPDAQPDVPTQLVRSAVLQWRDGVGEARLLLNPEHLGEVTISLRVEQGGVFASIRAESPAALQVIQARQQELQAALEAQGLHLDHFLASADPDGRRDQGRDRPPQQRREHPVLQDDPDTPRFEVIA